MARMIVDKKEGETPRKDTSAKKRLRRPLVRVPPGNFFPFLFLLSASFPFLFFFLLLLFCFVFFFSRFMFCYIRALNFSCKTKYTVPSKSLFFTVLFTG